MKAKRQNNGRGGFTLTELAIFLGIVGIVSGGIWAAASAVQRKTKIQDTLDVVNHIAQNARGIYTGTPKAVPPTALADQITAGLFPDSVVNGTLTRNPWGGLYGIGFNRATGPNIVTVYLSFPFAASLQTRNEACLDLVSRNPGSGKATGVGPMPEPLFPTPTPIPSRELAEGAGPSNSYIGGGMNGWVDVTGKDPLKEIKNLGAAGCQGVAFAYWL